MKIIATFLSLFFVSSLAAAEGGNDTYTLDEVIAYGLKNNPKVRSATTDIDIETYGVRSAQADRMPRLDLNGGVTKYRYPAAVTPLYGTPPANIKFPEFDTTIYDAGVTFTLPLYRGGRLDRTVRIAELRRSAAEDLSRTSKQELVYNLTSTYYKILQLEKLLQSNEEAVKQLEAHKKDVELFLQAGTAPRADLLKTETELAHAKQAALISRNSLESAYEFLRTLMGMEDVNRRISLVEGPAPEDGYPPLEESLRTALEQRPDCRAAVIRREIAEHRVSLVQGKRLPSLNIAGDYTERSGAEADLKENWTLGIRLTVPLFEGGTISAEVNKARAELLKAREDERSLRLDITRDVRDAYLSIENAHDRISAAGTAVESAKENLRIEQLRYRTGAGTGVNVIDAETVLLRAETDYYQALYDKYIALASLRRAVGEDPVNKEVEK